MGSTCLLVYRDRPFRIVPRQTAVEDVELPAIHVCETLRESVRQPSCLSYGVTKENYGVHYVGGHVEMKTN